MESQGLSFHYLNGYSLWASIMALATFFYFWAIQKEQSIQGLSSLF